MLGHDPGGSAALSLSLSRSFFTNARTGSVSVAPRAPQNPARQGGRGDHAAGVDREDAQHLVLGGEGHGAPAHGDAAARVVDGEPAVQERTDAEAAAQRRSDPRDEFGGPERLDDVVRGVALERAGDGLVVAVAGDDDDGQVGEFGSALRCRRCYRPTPSGPDR